MDDFEEETHGFTTNTPKRKPDAYDPAWKAGAAVLSCLLVAAFISAFLVMFFKKEEVTLNRVIIMIGDGYGPGAVTLARIMKNSSLVIDESLAGTVSTSSFDSLVTDSAAAATAYACGLKTNNGAAGLDKDDKPCATILEAAKKKGWKTGLVTTSTLSHATPAAFSAHAWRQNEGDIAKQQVALGIDLMLGGGLKYYRPIFNGKTSVNGTTLITEWNASAPLEMPVLGAFAEGHMSYMIDRPSLPSYQPTLSEMTRKALKTMKPYNFFMMIEGSRIDHAAHSNDPWTMYREALEFDLAVAEVKQFLKKDNIHSKQLVLITADHETGGFTLGSANMDGSYPPYEITPELLAKMQRSSEFMVNEFVNGDEITFAALQTLVTKYGGPALPESMFTAVIANARRNPGELVLQLSRVISKIGHFGWTTPAHTGVDVNLYTMGNQDSGFKRQLKNIDLPRMAMSLFGLEKYAEKAAEDLDPKPVPRGTLDRILAHGKNLFM